ncbi:MAG: hypothetical protein LAT75_08320 [Candidatus Cyclonatronum sp.]|uniref:hypothetical protein n=1 Tax=Cyclonatronum sp. TaxID=3024185 RepID=UPI0025BD2A4C|nr:hypothetical protein [Cyclonatronum sp.]MCH8486856.1 hypothetical protein [Cyclonatronum sp.]
MNRYSDLTKYPKLFKNSYWGSFQVDKDPPEKEIVSNRNRFSEEYELISFICSERPKVGSKLFDHCELYKSKNGFTFITSPYDENSNDAERFGLTKYLKLYHPASNTYIKHFNSKIEFNKFLKNPES